MANIILSECKHIIFVFNVLYILYLLKWGDFYAQLCIMSKDTVGTKMKVECSESCGKINALELLVNLS